jgi:hypothetical protein
MANCGSRMPENFRRQAAELGLGKTRDYPMGKLNDQDQGAINMAVAADLENQRVILNLGTPVAWVGFTYEQAMALSESFRDRAFELRGIRE